MEWSVVSSFCTFERAAFRWSFGWYQSRHRAILSCPRGRAYQLHVRSFRLIAVGTVQADRIRQLGQDSHVSGYIVL